MLLLLHIYVFYLFIHVNGFGFAAFNIWKIQYLKDLIQAVPGADFIFSQRKVKVLLLDVWLFILHLLKKR